MADGLATAALLFLLPLALIAAGVALWVNRPQRNEHDASPRIQPLFTSDLVPAVDPEADDDELIDNDELDAESHAEVSSTRGGASFAPPARAHRADAAPHPSAAQTPGSEVRTDEPRSAGVRPAMPVRPIPPQPRPTAPVHARPTSAPNGPSYPQAPGPRAIPQDMPLSRVSQLHAHARPQQQPMQHQPSHQQPLQQAWADGQAVRFNVPVDGTLQFLPGRLEIISGQEPGREIRFVRLPDAADPEITFGRNEGALYRHVQLRDATVSRLHARMVMRNGAWTLTNLSTTNPVMHNGAVLGDGEAQVLADNDRVEMGEVVFRFRAR